MRRTTAVLLILMLALSILSLATATARDREPPRVPQCFDGIDNDDDGLIDRRDPNCSSPLDNSEAPPDRGNSDGRARATH